MKTSFIIFSLFIFFGCSNSRKSIVVPEADWNQAETAFNELNQALKEEGGRLWDCSLEGPLMLVNRETRSIIANESDNSGELIKRGTFYIGKLPDNINIANTAFDWNGKRWTIVALPLPDTKEERLNLLIHESFHRIQPAIGFDSLYESQNAHLDTKNGRIYLKLELEALKSALSSTTPEVHLKNALLFRHYRYHLFPEAKNAENSLELNEGLAEYTGSVLSQRNESDLKAHYISQINRFFTLPTFVRSFPYFTIPVYGYFMHQTDKKWNLGITKKTNLADYISHFYGIISSESNAEYIMELGAKYGIDSIADSETQIEVAKKKLIQKYKDIFLSDSIVEIGLENMNIGFSPSNIMPLDSYGTIYPNLRITDNWGILEVDSCGALMSPGWSMVTISYPEIITDSLVLGKGWKLKIYDTWKLSKINNKYRMTRK